MTQLLVRQCCCVVLLRQSTTQGRAVLQRVMQGRITFTTKCGGYEFEPPTRFDKLFLGVAVEISTKREVNYESTEHIGPEDTFDADYGRLLEAVQNRGKGLASPRGVLPFTMHGAVVPRVA